MPTTKIDLQILELLFMHSIEEAGHACSGAQLCFKCMCSSCSKTYCDSFNDFFSRLLSQFLTSFTIEDSVLWVCAYLNFLVERYLLERSTGLLQKFLVWYTGTFKNDSLTLFYSYTNQYYCIFKCSYMYWMW